MTIHVASLADTPPQPWRNGGGSTRELLAWPDAAAWSLRISVAEIERDGPFSAFPGVERWFAVIEGAGVLLGLDPPRSMSPGDAPLRFDGAAAPSCRLIDGPTRDLNLMLRGATGRMHEAQPGVPSYDDGAALHALYAAEPGRWSDAQGQAIELPAHSLLWREAPPPGPFRFDARGWWLNAFLTSSRR